MKSATVACVVALVAPAAGLQFLAQRNPSELEGDSVKSVITMLQGLLEKSKSDAVTEREDAAKNKCQCEQEQEEYTKAIEDATGEIEESSSLASELKGRNGVTHSNNVELQNSLDENAKSVSDATRTRDEAAQAFTTKKGENEQAVTQLEAALEILEGVGASQTGSSSDHDAVMAKDAFINLKTRVSKAMQVVGSRIDASQSSTIQSLLQAPGENYAARSGGIYGILHNMKETLETQLQADQATETREVNAFAAFTQTKLEEEARLKQALEEGQQSLATTDDELASQLSRTENGKKLLESNQKLLAESKKACDEHAQFYAKTNLERTSSDAAISQAIAILNSDEAFERFRGAEESTAGIAFIQVVSSKVASSKKEHVFQVLWDRIAKVQTALQREKAEDESMMAWCEAKTAAFTKKNETLTSNIEEAHQNWVDLDQKLAEKRVDLQEQEKALQDSLQEEAKDQANREQEHRKYQVETKDLSSSVKFIEKAVKVLESHYQAGREVTVNTGGVDVIEKLKDIKKKFADRVTQANTDEQTLQGAHEDKKALADKLQSDTEQAIDDIKLNINKLKTDMKDTKTLNTTKTQEQESESTIFADVDKKCQWVRDNQNTRETNRQTERLALEEVKAKVKQTDKFQADCARLNGVPEICQ